MPDQHRAPPGYAMYLNWQIQTGSNTPHLLAPAQTDYSEGLHGIE